MAMGQSKTLLHGEEMPSWARYSVQICHSAALPNRPDVLSEPEQVFSSRIDAERFAYAVSEHYIAKTPCGMTAMWSLVNALAASHGVRVSYGLRHCYLSVDPGRVTVKKHAIGAGYYGAKCTTCNQSREAA
jgi:hypothetical protein